MSPRTQQWYPQPSVTLIGNGAKVNIHLLEGECCQATIEKVKNKLARKWGMPALMDLELEELQRELAEQGYNLPEIAASRGDERDNLTRTQRLDVEQKERGDLAEILAEMTQKETRSISEEDIFLPFRRKITIAVSEHGTDYIAFRFDDTHQGIMPKESEFIVLGESKCTSSASDLKTACQRTRSWILERLTKRRLYAEFTNIAEEYKRYGREWKRVRVLGFIPSIYRRDERLIVSTTMLYTNSVSDQTAVSDFERYILGALDSHQDGAIPHPRFEALLFKTVDMDYFCESCYEDFSR